MIKELGGTTGAIIASAGSRQFSRRFEGPANPKSQLGQKPVAKAPNVEVLPPVAPDTPRLTELATEIKVEHEQGLAACHRGFEHFLRVGELLLQAKVAAGHGKWTEWLRSNTAISETAARGYTRMAEKYPNLDAEKRHRVADLPWREALKAIARPHVGTTPTSTRATATSSAGERSERRVKALSEAWHDAEPPEREKFRKDVAALEAATPEVVSDEDHERAEVDARLHQAADTDGDLFARRRRQLADLDAAWERADSAVRQNFLRRINAECAMEWPVDE